MFKLNKSKLLENISEMSLLVLIWSKESIVSEKHFNLNKAGLFDGSFFLGGSVWPLASYLLNGLMSFNEIFRKDVSYDNIKRHKKTRFHPFIRRYIFRETTGGSNWPPPPAVLGLRKLQSRVPITLLRNIYEY